MTVGTALTPFAEWLAEQLARRGSSRSKLAAGINSKPQTVSAWFNEGRIPSPDFCRRVAEYLHVPVEDVLRIAGHLPMAMAEEKAPYDLPDWAELIPSLTPGDAEYVGRLVESLAREPVHPPEEPAQGEH